MRFEYNGKVYFRWVEDGVISWTTTVVVGSEVSDELAKELEEAFMSDPERRRVWGPRDWESSDAEIDLGWYMNYLDESERIEGGKNYAGDLDPNDATHETGAATLG